jgi:hypothetical protein
MPQADTGVTSGAGPQPPDQSAQDRINAGFNQLGGSPQDVINADFQAVSPLDQLASPATRAGGLSQLAAQMNASPLMGGAGVVGQGTLDPLTESTPPQGALQTTLDSPTTAGPTATTAPTATTTPPAPDTATTPDQATPPTPPTAGATPPDTTQTPPATATPPASTPPTSAPGGGAKPPTAGAMPQFNIGNIMQALMRGGPLGALGELAREAMGGGGGQVPWAPGYGPQTGIFNRQQMTPTLEKQSAPYGRDAQGNPKPAPGAKTGAAPPATKDGATPPATPNAAVPPTQGAAPPDTAPRLQTAGLNNDQYSQPLTSTGNYRTSPVTMNPYSRHVPPMKPTQSSVDVTPLANEANSERVARQGATVVNGEVSITGKNIQAQRVQLETARNRVLYGRLHGGRMPDGSLAPHTMEDALQIQGHRSTQYAAYHPSSTYKPVNEQTFKWFQKNVWDPVMKQGTNISDVGWGPMTGNASANVAAHQYYRGQYGYSLNNPTSHGDDYFREHVGPNDRLPPMPGTSAAPATTGNEADQTRPELSGRTPSYPRPQSSDELRQTLPSGQQKTWSEMTEEEKWMPKPPLSIEQQRARQQQSWWQPQGDEQYYG